MTKFNGQHVIVSGNLSEGFVVYGPYEDFEDAAAASDGAEVWIMSLGTPADAEKEL